MLVDRKLLPIGPFHRSRIEEFPKPLNISQMMNWSARLFIAEDPVLESKAGGEG